MTKFKYDSDLQLKDKEDLQTLYKRPQMPKIRKLYFNTIHIFTFIFSHNFNSGTFIHRGEYRAAATSKIECFNS